MSICMWVCCEQMWCAPLTGVDAGGDVEAELPEHLEALVDRLPDDGMRAGECSQAPTDPPAHQASAHALACCLRAHRHREAAPVAGRAGGGTLDGVVAAYGARQLRTVAAETMTPAFARGVAQLDDAAARAALAKQAHAPAVALTAPCAMRALR